MSNDSNLQDSFKLISYKKRNKKTHDKINTTNNSTNTIDDFDEDVALRRIHAAKEDLLTSDIYSSLLALLRECQGALLNPEIKEIVCLGLGNIGECMSSRYQLALVLCLKDLYKVKIHVFDPKFTKKEKCLLKEWDCEVSETNLQAKYHVDQTTLFFLPHCPKQLTNNLLWANWGLQLTNCIIIANDFMNIIENNTKKNVRENAQYIFKISPYVLDLAIINTFKYYDIFNDLAIHVFPHEKLCLLSADFWNLHDEPEYASKDVEFITDKLQCL